MTTPDDFRSGVRTALEARLTSGGGDTFTVLGAGNDDLEAGRRTCAPSPTGAGRCRRGRRSTAASARHRRRPRWSRRELAALRRARPVPVSGRRSQLVGADAARARHARAVRALAAGDRAPATRSGASCSPSRAPAPTSPALATPRRTRRRRVARDAARRSGPAAAHYSQWGLAARPHRPDVPKHAGHHGVRARHATRPASTSARCAR